MHSFLAHSNRHQRRTGRDLFHLHLTNDKLQWPSTLSPPPPASTTLMPGTQPPGSMTKTANDVINFAQFLMRLQLIFARALLKASSNVCDRNCTKRIRSWLFYFFLSVCGQTKEKAFAEQIRNEKRGVIASNLLCSDANASSDGQSGSRAAAS